ncbi:LacI family DNA-binding transcriptional regulator [Consotaella aegiceratis]|uniref:LacI family DNA-binding transcriptional regulator n=1 Tax=Consotaella aegiceratis TaxID=3097961 RepID=UPI002F3FB5A5
MAAKLLQPRPTKKTVSIARLAAHLGLSEGTVSRALNNYPDISRTTRERVARVARELGYRPSSTARRLARGVVETVGFVLPGRAGHVSAPFLAEFLDGIASELALYDWDVIVAAVPEGHEGRDVVERLIRSGKVGGFVLTRTRRSDSRVAYLKQEGVPFVLYGRTDACDDCVFLDVDNEKAFVDAVNHLHGLGHRRIAHLAGDLSYTYAHLRRRGYRAAMAALGLDIPDGYIVDGVVDAASSDSATTGLLALPNPPTAILGVTDEVALGAMRAIARAGLKVGRDISVMGYDGLPIGLAAEPPLTTMSQSSADAGRHVAHMIKALIEDGTLEEPRVLWEAKLTPRASTSRPPAEEPT